MAYARSRWIGVLATMLVPVLADLADAACDPLVNAVTLAAARAAVDASCPCATATSRGAYRRCANDVVRALVLTAQLPLDCRREALRHAKQSVCGRPGAVVCCRTRADGRTRHKVARTAAACTASSSMQACVSGWQSVPTGCTDTGCVPFCGNGVVEAGEDCDPPDGVSCSATCRTISPPACGNGVLESGEACDPPDYVRCDATCQVITCELPPTTCGNGTVDAGEACDPPGVGACGRDCELAPCAPPDAGEIGVACVEQLAGVAAAGRPGGYLLAWDGLHARSTNDVLARRSDADGMPLDAGATVLSADAPCGGTHTGPAVGSDGSDNQVVWSASGALQAPSDSFFYQAMFGRRILGTGTTEALQELAFDIPFGTCRTVFRGPTMASGAGPARFAVGWEAAAFCGGFLFRNPVGLVLDFAPSPSPMSVPLGYPLFSGAFPWSASLSSGSVGTLGVDTLWAWNAGTAASVSGPFSYFVAAIWSDASGSTSPATLSSRIDGSDRRPRVAAGATSLLVAWAQPDTVGGTPREIRGLRTTRASGNLDPDGGLLLATVATSITGGPDAAFDGTRWLVAWTESSPDPGDELRAVAVEQDGTVVDASPRLVATNVVPGEPAVASAGDGRALVLYRRAAGTHQAVRARLVTP